MASDKKKIILEFAKDHQDIPELQFINEDPEGIIIKEIGEIGFVNYIFRVQSSDRSKSVILKYGETTMRQLDEEISLDRQKREYDALVVLQSFLPDNGVKPYCLDTNHNIIAMEDLSHMELLGYRLRAGDIDCKLAGRLGRLVAKLHQMSAKDRVDPKLWQQWEASFRKKESLDEMASYLSRVFDEDDPITLITDHTRPTFRKCVQEVANRKLLPKIFDLFFQGLCFIHADCHCLAVFVKDEDIKLFDFEFVMLGHGAQNLSYLANSYLLWTREAARKPGLKIEEVLSQAKQAFRKIIESYLEEHEDLQDEDTRKKFLKDLALFCGFNIFLYTNPVGLEKCISLTDDDKIHCMEVGLNLLKQHEDITTVDQITEIAFP